MTRSQQYGIMEVVPCRKEAGSATQPTAQRERRETNRQENKHTEEEKSNTTMMMYDTKKDSTLHTLHNARTHSVCNSTTSSTV